MHKDLCSQHFRPTSEQRSREAKNKSIPNLETTTLQFRLLSNWISFRRLPRHKNGNLGGWIDLHPKADMHRNYPEFPELSEDAGGSVGGDDYERSVGYG